MNRTKVVVLWEISLMMLNDILGISTKLLFPQGEELAGITVLFKKEAMALAIRIAAEVGGGHAKLGQVAIVNL
jgi:hypothetical protein